MGSGWHHQSWFVVALALVQATAVVLWARHVAATRPDPRRVAVLALGVVAWSVLCLGPWRAAIPADWLTPLQEGFSGDALDRIAGGGLHGLPGQGVIVAALGRAHGIRDVVALGIWATGVSALLLGTTCARLAGPGPAVVLVAAWLLAPITRSAALSTEAAPLVTLWLLLGAPALLGAPGVGVRVRVGLLAAIAAVVATMRPEVAPWPALAALTVAAEARWPRLRALEARWARLLGHPVAPLVLVALGLGHAALGSAFSHAVSASLPVGDLRVPLTAVHPLNAAWITPPLFGIALLPPGLVVLAVAGAWAALRRPLASGLLPLGFAVTWQAWYAAAHGLAFRWDGPVAVNEMFRYATLATPVAVLFAAAAVARAPAIPRAVLLAACLLPPSPEAIDLHPQFLAWHDPRSAPWPRFGLVDGDLQRQTRAVVALMDERPDCPVLTRGRRWGSSPDAPVVEDVLLRRGPRSLMVSRLPPAEGLAPERLPEAVRGGCLVVLASVDCGLAGGQVDCAPLVAGLPKLAEHRFPARPWTYADHTGGWTGETQSFAFYDGTEAAR